MPWLCLARGDRPGFAEFFATAPTSLHAIRPRKKCANIAAWQEPRPAERHLYCHFSCGIKHDGQARPARYKEMCGASLPCSDLMGVHRWHSLFKIQTASWKKIFILLDFFQSWLRLVRVLMILCHDCNTRSLNSQTHLCWMKLHAHFVMRTTMLKKITHFVIFKNFNVPDLN